MAWSFLGVDYSTADVNLDQKQFPTETENYNRQTIDLGVERYRIAFSFELDDGTKMAASKFRRHRQKHGFHSRFTMPMPQDRGVGPAPTVDVTAAEVTDAESSTIVLETGDRTVVIPEGRFITFSGHKKVYVIDSFSYNSGQTYGVAKIQPDLQKRVADGEEVDFDPDITVRYSVDGAFSFLQFQGILTALTFTVVEDINAP